jgi:hypothetical protein
LDTMTLLLYSHHSHPPLIIALLFALIIWFNIFFMIILIKTLCGWSSIIWGGFLRLITWILCSYIAN